MLLKQQVLGFNPGMLRFIDPSFQKTDGLCRPTNILQFIS